MIFPSSSIFEFCKSIHADRKSRKNRSKSEKKSKSTSAAQDGGKGNLNKRPPPDQKSAASKKKNGTDKSMLKVLDDWAMRPVTGGVCVDGHRRSVLSPTTYHC